MIFTVERSAVNKRRGANSMATSPFTTIPTHNVEISITNR